MTDKIVLVTPPDDIALDGKRILTVNLTQEQQELFSDALKKVENDKNIIVYIWNDQDTDWLFDKKPKADSIIFNADSSNDLIVGYMAAQPNSYYFGSLKSLHLVNNSAIYSVDQCVDIITR
jgi:hypothetical protein